MKAAAKIDPATLPRDPDALIKMLVEISETLQHREEYIVRLQHIVGKSQRWQFGQRSERITEGQQIFEFYGTVEAEKLAEDKDQKAPRARQRPKRGGYRVIPKDIPRKVETVEPRRAREELPQVRDSPPPDRVRGVQTARLPAGQLLRGRDPAGEIRLRFV